MATLSSVISDYKKGDGTYNVMIRITHNRKTFYLPTRHYLSQKQLSKDLKRIKDPEVLDEVNAQIMQMRKEISSLQNLENYSAKGLVKYFKERLNRPGAAIDLIAYIREQMAELKKAKRTSTATIYQTLINHLIAYAKKEVIDVREVSRMFLTKFEAYLMKNNTGSRGIELYFVYLKVIFKSARLEYNDEDLGIIRIPNNPFEFYTIPRAKTPEKRALTIEQLKMIRDYKHERGKYESYAGESRAELARDVFMLSFYLCGMNSVDLYYLKDIVEGRVEYNRAKTKRARSDQAFISIKIEPEAQLLIDKYRSRSKNHALNFFTRYSDEKTFNSNLNKGLKTIGKKIGIEDLEFYAARHTWATIADNHCKIPVTEIGLCLNHAESRMVTYKYIKKDFSKIDGINREVLGMIY